MSRERVLELIEAAEVERITADVAIARRMLEDAGRHLATASQAKRPATCPGRTNSLMTPCARAPRACLRPKACGQLAAAGHIAVQECGKQPRPSSTGTC